MGLVIAITWWSVRSWDRPSSARRNGDARSWRGLLCANRLKRGRRLRRLRDRWNGRTLLLLFSVLSVEQLWLGDVFFAKEWRCLVANAKHALSQIQHTLHPKYINISYVFHYNIGTVTVTKSWTWCLRSISSPRSKSTPPLSSKIVNEELKNDFPIFFLTE